MTAIVTSKYRIWTARDFKENFADASATDRNFYIVIAKPSPWSDDFNPPLPLDCQATEFDLWQDALGLKRIAALGVSHVIQRRNWATGTIYFAYRSDDADLFLHPTTQDVADYAPARIESFYVITDDYNVYKCLDNNYFAPSTVKPTGTSISSFQTSDGYIWKYLYTVIQSDIDRFVTDEWIPVQTLEASEPNRTNQWAVQSNAVAGTIDSIFVSSRGSGATNTNAGAIGSASGVSVVLDASASTQNSIYVNATIFITSGVAIGQHRVITAYDGTTKTATIDSAFGVNPAHNDTYTILPTIQIVGDGINAYAQATVVAGQIVSATVINPGSGYHSAAITVVGCGIAGATLVASISPQNGHGVDPVEELGGFFVMMNVKLAYQEGAGDFPITNDYRKVGIVRNVKKYDGSLPLLTDLTLKADPALILTGVTGGDFEPDDIVSVTSPVSTSPARARVVEYNSTSHLLTIVQDVDTGFKAFAAADTISNGSGVSGSVSSTVNPEVQRFSGDLLYIEYRRPIMRASDQIEDIKFIVEF